MPEGQEPQTQNQQPQDDDLRAKVGDDAYKIIQEVREEAAGYRVKLREYEQLGDTETLKLGKSLYDATRTEHGLKQLVEEASQALGLPEDKVRQLWADDIASGRELSGTEGSEGSAQQPTGADQLTPEQVKELAREAAGEPLAQFEEQQSLKEKQTAAQNALKELGLEDPSDQYDVLSYANKYVTDQSSANEIVSAIKQGHNDWKTRLDSFGELAVQKYLEEKSADGDVPQPLSGGAPAVGEASEPAQSVGDATKRLKQRLGLA